MKTLYDIYYLLKRKLVETKRNPVFIFMNIVYPFFYLLFYSPLLKNLSPNVSKSDVINSFVPGMLVMIACFGGLFSGYSIIDELRSGIIERFRVTPTARFAILAGPVFRDIITTICQMIFFSVISLFLDLELILLVFLYCFYCLA